MLQCRGRSRQVANSAIARQASEERRYTHPTTTTTTTTTTATATCTAQSTAHRRLCIRATISVSTERTHSPSTSLKQSLNAPDTIHILAPIPIKSSLPPHFIRSPSPSPLSSASMSPDYYDSPPSPPQSLEDQLHVAYAHDDIHLAKILLLRLKGIEVTSDDDPRIAAVQDEDFDFCFVPNGRLMDDRDEKEMKERQQIERQRIEEKLREERLRACERIWAVEKRRLREERVTVLRTREMKRVEEEERRKKRDQEEKARILEEERRRVAEEAHWMRMRTKPRNEKRVVCYDSLQRPSKETDKCHSFMYDFMPLTSSRTRKQPLSCSPPSSISNSRHHFPAPSFDDSHSIPFTDVLESMKGPLFPISNEERQQRNNSPSRLRTQSQSKTHSQARRRREVELWQALLVEVEFSEVERRKKLKGKARVAPRSQRGCRSCQTLSSSSSSESLPVSPTSPTSTQSSPSSSSSSRPSSWLSFRSSSSTSSSSSVVSPTSTAATTPSTSPISSSPKSGWFKTTSGPTFTSRRSSWMSTLPLPSPPPIAEPGTSSSDCGTSCHCLSSKLTLVTLEECPLSFDSAASSLYPTSPNSYSTSLENLRDALRIQRQQSLSASLRSKNAAESAGILVRKVSSHLVDIAKGLQNAYVTTALFSVAASSDVYEEREGDHGYSVEEKGETSDEKWLQVEKMKWQGKQRPAGYRVSPSDLAAFLDAGTQSTSYETASNSCLGSSMQADDIHPNSDRRANKFNSRSSSRPPSSPPSAKYIPLGSPYPPQLPHSTVLPDPLPYKLVFKPIPPPTRSPFRFNAFSHLHTTYPSADQFSPLDAPPQKAGVSTYNAVSGIGYSATSNGGVSWRVRSVSNPVHLRLKALQNFLWSQGCAWEGRGKEMGLGGGRDRVVGIAYEGVGCSPLSVGVS